MKIAVVTDVMGKSPEPEYREQYFNVKTLESVLGWISEASDMEAEITGKELEYHIVTRTEELITNDRHPVLSHTRRYLTATDPRSGEILYKDGSGMGWTLEGVKALVVADTEEDWEMITDVLEMTSRWHSNKYINP
jgi:uncharacterized protein YrzB (UPF0473 family)